jgi:hypothetical protein
LGIIAAIKPYRLCSYMLVLIAAFNPEALYASESEEGCN